MHNNCDHIRREKIDQTKGDSLWNLRMVKCDKPVIESEGGIHTYDRLRDWYWNICGRCKWNWMNCIQNGDRMVLEALERDEREEEEDSV